MKRVFLEEKIHTMRWVGAVAILGLLLAACAPATPAATNTPVPTTPVSTDTPAPTATAAATTAPVATTAPTSAATSAATMAATATSGTPAASTGVVVNVATDATLGKILTDGTGMTLYKYASDTSGTSTCSATCLANWPPLLATGAVVPDPSLTASDFSTTMTTDGRSMVTYKGSPLYHFKGDAAAGDTKGNGVGGVWSVVAP